MFTKEELIEIRNLIDGSKDKLTDETSRIRNSIASKVFSELHSRPQEEPVSEDFEKEMDNYIPTVFSKDMDSGEPRFTTWFRALRKTARHFADWQKQQMTQGALNGYYNCGTIEVEDSYSSIIHKMKKLGILFGDKVKLIIIKED